MSLAFNESIIEKQLNKKIRFSVFLIFFTFVFVLSRLWYLQIIKGHDYLEQSINNRIRITKIPAPRGNILTEKNVVLVKNVPSFDLSIIPQDVPDVNAVLQNLSELLETNDTIFKEKISKKRGRPPFEAIVLKKELSWNEMSLILSRKTDLPGINIAVIPKRFYCFDNLAPHVLGFLGEVNFSEINKYKKRAYLPGDVIGKYGIEKLCEQTLRGKMGGMQTEVDVFGNRKKTLAEISPVSGKNTKIFIVPKLQKIACAQFKEKNGAVVAIDPNNGKILVLASFPSFNSNLFARGIDIKEWRKLINNPFHPLLNKAIQSTFPPGSVFKVITAIAALEEKNFDPEKKFFCPGYFKLGNRKFNCWKKGGHGWMNMKEAIVCSCDCYFYNISLRIGINKISHYAGLFGLGEKTGIDLPGEKPGFVPTAEWKLKKYGSSWQKGETLNVSIGQGFLLTTPIQIAALFSGIATGGYIHKPTILIENGVTDAFPSVFFKETGVSKKTLLFLKNALSAVVNSPGGTGAGAKLKNVLVAGKTGTAQVVSNRVDDKDETVPWYIKDHAWFVAFAPVENPKIVVCVFVEHGGSGGRVAAPIAREIIKGFFN
ncbi:MAG: penicillin-binding protein 2 [Alphaproteobacteria bacterium]